MIDRFPRDKLRRGVWVMIPLGIFLGDILFRWQGSIPQVAVASPANLLVSIALSMGFWWGISRLIATQSRWRLIPAGLISGIFALLVCSSWQYKYSVGGEATVSTAMYLLQEPANAATLFSAAITWSWTLALAVLAVAGTAVLGAWRAPVSRLTRVIGLVAVLGFLFITRNSQPDVPTNGSPYISDFKIARLFGQAARNLARRADTFLPVNPRIIVEPQMPVDTPNVLLIVNESLRRDHMHVFGYERENTPRMDAFFAKNASHIYDFPHAFATGSSTLLAWTSILTGRYIAHSRATLGAVPLPWQYARALGVSTFVVSPQDWSWMGMGEIFLTFDPPDYWAMATSFDEPVVNDTGIDDLIAVGAVVERLDAYARAKTPFFGIFQTNATHMPFELIEEVEWPIDSVMGRYDAAIARNDRVVGELIDGLRDADLLDNTILIFTSDHAEFMYGDTDVEPLDTVNRPSSCHPSATHIPFFLYVPAKWEDKIDVEQLRANTSRVVSHVDLLPTMLDLWGLDASPAAQTPVSMDGRSLMTPVSDERSVWCFNQPGWWDLSIVGFGAYSRERMAYMRADAEGLRFMNSQDWVERSKWRRWDTPTEADHLWLSETISQSAHLRSYTRKIRARNPSLLENLTISAPANP